jgi:hypothetical protein
MEHQTQEAEGESLKPEGRSQEAKPGTPNAGRRTRSTGLIALLVVSLAANVGVLGSLGVNKYKDWRWEVAATKKYMRRPDAYRILDRQYARYFRVRDTLDRTYWSARHELGRLALAPTIDSARVESLFDVVERAALWYTRTRDALSESIIALSNDRQQAMWRRLAREAADSLHRADSLKAAKGGGR